MVKLLMVFVSAVLIFNQTAGAMRTRNVQQNQINPSGEFSRWQMRPPVHRELSSWHEKGSASYYGQKFHGSRMANRERYNMYRITFAHNTLPMGTVVKVTNLKNGLSVIGPVTDRGSFGRKYGRIIDLSRAAMKKIDGLHDGVVPVKIQVLSYAGT
ncbi:MAG: septal ring lytic transglycosylase RlpA family protein [Minisyncoccota bacterium]